MALHPNGPTTAHGPLVASYALGTGQFGAVIADASPVIVATDEGTAHEPICVSTTLSNALVDRVSTTSTSLEATV